MAGLELLSEQGFRADGRRAGELRKLRARMGVFARADGSAYIEQGNTKALAVVYGPHEVGPPDAPGVLSRHTPHGGEVPGVLPPIRPSPGAGRGPRGPAPSLAPPG